MAEYRAIRVEKGNGGFGGPLVIQGTEKKNKVMYITGGGIAARQAPWPSSSRKTSTSPA